MSITLDILSPGSVSLDAGGAKLVQGPPGEAATVAIGSVARGDEASVVNSGSETHAVLDFVLPKGDAGPQGPAGQDGAQGPAGADGAPGADGKSAYQYALEAGYTGTEADLGAALAGLGDLNGILDAINGEVV